MPSFGRFGSTRKEGIAEITRDLGPGLAAESRDERSAPAKIVLIDDRWEELAPLRELIEQSSDMAVVAACRCAAGAMLAVEKYRPAVVILDVRLPDRDGVELIREITTTSEAKVIVFTPALQEEGLVSVLRSGAKAVVFKDQPASMLISWVRKVLAEKPRMVSAIVPQEPPSGAESLTAREREIAQWAAAGARSKEIAWQLGISEGTVKLHLFRAYRKLRVGNRVGLVLALRRATADTLTGITFVSLTFV